MVIQAVIWFTYGKNLRVLLERSIWPSQWIKMSNFCHFISNQVVEKRRRGLPRCRRVFHKILRFQSKYYKSRKSRKIDRNVSAHQVDGNPCTKRSCLNKSTPLDKPDNYISVLRLQIYQIQHKEQNKATLKTALLTVTWLWGSENITVLLLDLVDIFFDATYILLNFFNL